MSDKENHRQDSQLQPQQHDEQVLLPPHVLRDITHIVTVWQTPKIKCQNKLILCYVTSDTAVTLVTSREPRSNPKFQIPSPRPKSRVAVRGQRHAGFINLVILIRWRTIEQVQCLDATFPSSTRHILPLWFIYRPKLVQFPISCGNESILADLPRCVFGLFPRSFSLDGRSVLWSIPFATNSRTKERPEIRLSIDC